MLYMYSVINFAVSVTEVKTDIFVTSFGPVSDVKMVRKHSTQLLETYFLVFY